MTGEKTRITFNDRPSKPLVGSVDSRPLMRSYLDGERPEHDGTEDGVPEDAVEDVPLAVDLPGVDLVEQLHHDKGVEDDGVVL